ncbi:hypothetical protein J4462_04370 [Candidatus Pacearchaeota archaeon]|nr:hypothetical protein [Candidatus Pacearchaeota archaeon]
MIDELTSYIKKNLKKGYTKESLLWALTNQGYSKIEIERAFERADKLMAEEAPILKTKPEISYTYEIIGDKEIHAERKYEKPKKKSWRKWVYRAFR